MDYFIECLAFFCMFISMIMLVGYIKTIRSGKKISMHRYKNIRRWEIVLLVLLIAGFACIESKILDLPLKITYFISVYVIFVLILNSHPLITTDKGFYFKGQFMKWSNIVNFSIDDSNVLRMRRLTMIYMDIEIRNLSDLDTFIEMAQKNCSLKP